MTPPGGRVPIDGPKQPADLEFLVNDFVDRVPGVNEAVVVSAAGSSIAASSGLDDRGADSLSAVAAGLVMLAAGVAARFACGSIAQLRIDMAHASMFVADVADGVVLVALCSSSADSEPILAEIAEIAAETSDVLAAERTTVTARERTVDLDLDLDLAEGSSDEVSEPVERSAAAVTTLVG